MVHNSFAVDSRLHQREILNIDTTLIFRSSKGLPLDEVLNMSIQLFKLGSSEIARYHVMYGN